MSENVQQLIRETDHAFKAVGAALAEARAASESFEIPERPAPPPPNRKSSRASPAFRTVLKKQPKLVASPLASPTRNASISKSKRRKQKKQSSQAKAAAAASSRNTKTTKMNPRWTLSENVAELFTGQLFKRIEADEMLSPSRLQELRASREAQLRPRISSDTVRTEETEDESETPIEPFHLQDLPLRVREAGVKTSLSPIDATPPPVSFDEIIRRDFSLPKRKPAPLQFGERSRKDRPAPVALRTIALPSPPLKNPLRFISRSQMPQLPTIPEVLITAPQDDPAFSTPKRKFSSGPNFAPVENDDYVFFKSSPYTITMPTFKHGPIRFSKDEICKEIKLAADDTLDWTAFQMAILGGAGDFFSGSEDYTQKSEVDEADDLADWFSSFGFEHAGLLVPSPVPSSSDRDVPSLEASPATTAEYSPISSTATDLDLPIPVAEEYPSGFWNEGDYDASKFLSLHEGCGIKRWTVEGHPKRYTDKNRESQESLPQSPMMELVIKRSLASSEAEPVPMGYNLGHDLGDFLKWESEHAYAGGFYGSG
jgi:hypothetical protein